MSKVQSSITLLPTLFEKQVRCTPHRPAVVEGIEEVTYDRLNERVNRLAHHLIERGVGAEDIVVLAVPRSVTQVTAMLAVLKAGAAYLPIDPDYPVDRIDWVLRDALASLVISTAGTPIPGRFDGARQIRLDDPATAARIDACRSADPTDEDRRAPLSERSAAYVIYTSGSTGRPKGVVVEHRSLAEYLHWTSQAYTGTHGVSVVPTSVAFDLTITGLYTPLVAGGCVRLVSMPAYDPADIAGLRRAPASFLKVTPSHLALLTALPEEFAPAEELLLGGEALTASAVEPWRRRRPGLRVLNVYGPTEATVNCAEYPIEPGVALPPGPVPIGRPQPGVRLYVLDRAQREVQPGTTGELYIGGTTLARGYLRLPGLTADRFRPDPFGTPGKRMYRTGDLVYARPDGDLVFVGRADGQVKVRGHRIELGEIEAVLGQRPEVAQATCVVQEGNDGPEITAYVVPVRPGTLRLAGLRRYVGETLPRYMVPTSIVEIERLPLTPNGKVDRAALQTPAVPEKPDDVVLLRDGGAAPSLFCLHPNAGLGDAYRGLLPAVPQGRAVYALPAPWMADGQPSPAGFAELVAAHLRTIRRLQPHGPYHLFGAEIGGLVAHAIAVELSTAGEDVALLMVVDAAGDPGAGSVGEPAKARLPAMLGSLRTSLGRRLRLDEISAVSRVWRDAERLMRTYRPRPFDGDMVLAVADENGSSAQARNFWRPYVRGELDLYVVDAEPGHLLQPGPAAELARILATAPAMFSGPDGR